MAEPSSVGDQSRGPAVFSARGWTAGIAETSVGTGGTQPRGIFGTFGTGGPGGGSAAADTHLFRIENGKLRYVHTLTHLLQADFKGNTPKP